MMEASASAGVQNPAYSACRKSGSRRVRFFVSPTRPASARPGTPDASAEANRPKPSTDRQGVPKQDNGYNYSYTSLLPDLSDHPDGLSGLLAECIPESPSTPQCKKKSEKSILSRYFSYIERRQYRPDAGQPRLLSRYSRTGVCLLQGMIYPAKQLFIN